MSFERYKSQVDLLLDVLPIVAKHREFALKGGTALNLFHLDLPRLSVDIDLCYLPISDRAKAFTDMHVILKKVAKEIESRLKCRVTPTKSLDGKGEARLIVSQGSTEIKIEPNYILRGALFATVDASTSEKSEALFQKSSTVQCLNFNDLYGGKICAALDRQHPRDLFDMLLFFKTKTIDQDVKDAFLYYLISHNRPFHEVLAPTDQPLKEIFESDFVGMTTDPIDLEQLVKTRKKLKAEILSAINSDDQNLLLSIAKNQPNWKLSRHPKIQQHPSVLWRLHNIGKMDTMKRDHQANQLAKVFAK